MSSSRAHGGARGSVLAPRPAPALAFSRPAVGAGRLRAPSRPGENRPAGLRAEAPTRLHSAGRRQAEGPAREAGHSGKDSQGPGPDSGVPRTPRQSCRGALHTGEAKSTGRRRPSEDSWVAARWVLPRGETEDSSLCSVGSVVLCC